jgi:hypothetical protein
MQGKCNRLQAEEQINLHIQHDVSMFLSIPDHSTKMVLNCVSRLCVVDHALVFHVVHLGVVVFVMRLASIGLQYQSKCVAGIACCSCTYDVVMWLVCMFGGSRLIDRFLHTSSHFGTFV